MLEICLYIVATFGLREEHGVTAKWVQQWLRNRNSGGSAEIIFRYRQHVSISFLLFLSYHILVGFTTCVSTSNVI